jgi:ABC-type transport system substrate-binding protein
VDARLQPMELSTVNDRQFRTHDYDVVLGSWGVELSGTLAGLFAPDAHLNFVAFQDAETGRLIEQAEAQPTLATAAPAWRAVAERIVQMQPYTWLYYYGPVTGRSARLRGVKVDAYGGYQNTWEWWLAGGGAAGAADDTAKKDTGR